MTVRLTLICHASTSAVRAAAFPTDEPIDAVGRRQLRGCSSLAASADRVLTSPELRARQTADAFQVDAAVVPQLSECAYGRWSGRSSAEVQAQEPDAFADWLRDPGSSPHGGESLAALMRRIADWLDGHRGASGRITAFTHASVIRAAVVHALKADAQSFWRIDVAPLSTAVLTGRGDRWNLVSLGRWSRP